MTIRVLVCWALCAALVSADDKPKADEVKKPTTAAEAVEALTAKHARPKSLDEAVAIQDKIVKAADAVLAFKDASDEQKDKALVAKATALATKSMYKPDSANEFDEFAATLQKEHPNSPAMATVAAVKFRKKFMKTRPTKVDSEAIKELVALGKKYPKEEMFGTLYASFATLKERADGQEAAIKYLEEGVKIFPDNKRLAGILNGMKVMGNPLEIVGPTLEGSEFNIKSLKGKVVLVDFWATWCGPCVRELPNVKAAYEKYHGKGFEIVAVSFDNSREPLEKFVKEKELPWTQIVFSKEEDMGWKNPIGQKYGINSIPATFLIGRDGKVVKKDLHGVKLAEAIEEELAKSSASAN
jgi:thiol-disulfide isomerase/thioredoxin